VGTLPQKKKKKKKKGSSSSSSSSDDEPKPEVKVATPAAPSMTVDVATIPSGGLAASGSMSASLKEAKSNYDYADRLAATHQRWLKTRTKVVAGMEFKLAGRMAQQLRDEAAKKVALHEQEAAKKLHEEHEEARLAHEAEVARLAALAAAEEAQRLQAIAAAEAAEAAEVARLKMKAAALEVEKTKRLKAQAHVQWQETHRKLHVGAVLAYSAKAAAATKAAQEAEAQRLTALAAAMEAQRQKEAEEAERKRKAQMRIELNTVAASPPKAKAHTFHVAVSTVASEEVQADGTRIVTEVDGTTKQYNPDGIVIVSHTDGSVVQNFPDGIEILIMPDQTQIQTNPDGTVIQTLTDGMQITILPDGRRIQVLGGTQIVIEVDGSQTQTNPDGVQIWTDADGTAVQYNLDGTEVTTYIDGTQVISRPNSSKTTITPDGQRTEDSGQSSSTSVMKLQAGAPGGATAMRRSIMIAQNNTAVITVTAEDSGVSDFMYIKTAQVTKGKATTDGNQITYVPPSDFVGNVVVTYTIVGSSGNSVESELELNVVKTLEHDFDTGTQDTMTWRVDI